MFATSFSFFIKTIKYIYLLLLFHTHQIGLKPEIIDRYSRTHPILERCTMLNIKEDALIKLLVSTGSLRSLIARKYIIIQSKAKGKYQELIQPSTTPDPGHHFGIKHKNTRKHHTQEASLSQQATARCKEQT